MSSQVIFVEKKLDVMQDIVGALRMLKQRVTACSSYDCYTPCFIFSNENMGAYYPMFNINNGDVLTVCGSGDQVLMSILYGAKSVDCFDSNCLTYYNLMLKINAIKYLCFNDFYSFFDIDNRSVDRKSLFYKFNDLILDDDVKLFWNTIFESSGDLFLNFYREKVANLKNACKRVSYLNDEKYMVLKNSLCDVDISFKCIDLYDILFCYDKKYDFINLSNIFTYVDSDVDFISFINILKEKYLNSSGGIILDYSWSSSLDCYSEVIESIGARSVTLEHSYFSSDQPCSIMVYSKSL